MEVVSPLSQATAEGLPRQGNAFRLFLFEKRKNKEKKKEIRTYVLFLKAVKSLSYTGSYHRG
jgi:hypothetical protein